VPPSDLVELGRRALAAVASSVASGAPLVRCQLLASGFYVALRQELEEMESTERVGLIAAVDQCERAATASITPHAMLAELRGAVTLLQSDRHPPAAQPTRSRPRLRVIEGGLSRI